MPAPLLRLATICACLIGTTAAHADLAAIFADPADGQIIDIPTPLIESHLLGTEIGINGGFIYTTVFPFQLPPRPVGMRFGNAEFTSTVLRNFTTLGYGIDLYGLDPRATPELQVSDGYAGPLDAAATLIEDDYLRVNNTDISNWVSVSTTVETSPALTDYLNDAYDTVGPGGFIFIRLNIDDPAPPNPTVYFVRNTEWTFQGVGPRPRIVYEFVTPPCPADADGDDDVDFDDLNIVLDAWNTPGPDGDVNNSGLVDFDDLNEVLDAWGCPG